MKQITEDYCSFEIAKLLKEKGFDIPVRFEHHCVYNLDQKPQFHRLPHNFNGNEYSGLTSQWYSAPTHQMAMAWLREVHNIDIICFHEKLPNDCYWCRIEKYPYTEHQQEPVYKTYEQAVEAALKYSLENLI